MHSPVSPLRLRDRTLEDYRTDTPSSAKALEAARRFAAGQSLYLVLSGATGVGKTHLAAAASAARFAHDMATWKAGPDSAAHDAMVAAAMPWERVLPSRSIPLLPEWQNVVDLIVGLREDMSRPIEDKEWTTRAAKLRDHRGVVILDDLGREKTSDWTGETVYGIVNRRYESMAPTIVTTNLTGAELAASPYWPAISRLAEDGELVKIEGADHRLARP